MRATLTHKEYDVSVTFSFESKYSVSVRVQNNNSEEDFATFYLPRNFVEAMGILVKSDD